MRLRSILAIAALASASLIARADTYTVFTVNSTYNNQGTATIDGTITLDTSNGQFTSVDLNVSGFDLRPAIDVNLDSVVSQALTADNTEEITITNDDAKLIFDLVLPVDTLNGYTGGLLCSHGTSGCNSSLTVYDTIYGADTGNLTPATDPAPTPEPSTILLLGTGLLGVAGLLRRRLA